MQVVIRQIDLHPEILIIIGVLIAAAAVVVAICWYTHYRKNKKSSVIVVRPSNQEPENVSFPKEFAEKVSKIYKNTK